MASADPYPSLYDGQQCRGEFIVWTVLGAGAVDR